MYKNRHVVFALFLQLGLTTMDFAAAPAAGDDAAEKLATQVCVSCHGPGGNSTSPTFPKLAAQQPAYVVAQIKAFRGKTRGEPEAHDYMLGMATLIDDTTAEALGRFFARQSPPKGIPGDARVIAQGKGVFEHGVPDRGVVACATCHGATAAGMGIFPRLAGQHSAYVIKQLRAIQSQLRESPVMHGIVKDLKPDEMTALATFLQSLD